jgi:predicted esterase
VASDGRLHARPGVVGTVGAPAWDDVVELAVGDGGVALLAVPPAPRDDRPVPLIVMLHGATSDPNRALRYLGALAPPRGIAVLAPKSQDYTWDVILGGYGPDVAALDDALAQAFAALPVDPGRVAIGGFSDGASYALSIGLANGDLFGWVFAFSPGFVAPPALVGKPRVFVSHGTADPILNIDMTSRRIAPGLHADGYPVTYVEFEGGHELPGAVAEHALGPFSGPAPRP